MIILGPEHDQSQGICWRVHHLMILRWDHSDCPLVDLKLIQQ